MTGFDQITAIGDTLYALQKGNIWVLELDKRGRPLQGAAWRQVILPVGNSILS